MEKPGNLEPSLKTTDIEVAEANCQTTAQNSGLYSSLYISRYAPERSPTDPHTGLPRYLSKHTLMSGMWGKHKNPDSDLWSACRHIFEIEPTWRGWPHAMKLIFRFFDKHRKPDFILCGVDEFSLSLGIAAGIRSGSPVFSVIEDPPFTARYKSTDSRWRKLEKRFRVLMLKLLISRCKGIFCFIEQDVLNEFRPFKTGIFQMMNGVSSRALEIGKAVRPRQDEYDLIVGFIGAVDLSQGIDVLIKIFIQARKRLPDLRLRLIGPVSADYAPLLDAELQRSQLQGAVEITGWLPYEKMMEKLRDCFVGVYCNPSTDWYIHAQPLKICEYLGLSKPSVAWDYPGVRRLLDGGRLGILVPAGNIEAFSDGLVQLADLSIRKQKVTEIQTSVAERWSSDFWYQSLIDQAIFLSEKKSDPDHSDLTDS